MSAPAIEVNHLCKNFRVRKKSAGFRGSLATFFRPHYELVPAVKEISFSIGEGERVAFIGPNGAGKSTTIKMLTGILHPSGGSARVAGFSPWKERSKLAYKIGAVFGQRSQLWYHLPAIDTFRLLRHIYDLEKSFFDERLKKLVALFDIGNLLEKPVRQLSLGERMRCEIVASFLHQPKILFLDEPTIGLDVTAKTSIRELIKQRSEEEGCTVLLTSHDTGDMENVCDRVMVINHGELLLDQPVEALRRTYIRRKLITLHTEQAAQVALDLPGITLSSYEPHCTKVEVELGTTAVADVVAAAMKKTTLHDLTVEDPPMEEIIKAIYAETKQ